MRHFLSLFALCDSNRSRQYLGITYTNNTLLSKHRKEFPQKMKPIDRLNRCVVEYLGTMLGIFGFNVADPNYLPNYRSVCSFVFLLLISISAVYTIYMDDTLFGRLISGVMLSMNVQTAMKLSYFQRKDDINSFFTSIRKPFMEYENIDSDEHRRNIDSFASLFESFITRIIWGILISVILSYLLLPIVIYVVNGTVQPMLPVILPGINATNSYNGFAVTTLYHMSILTFYTIVILSADLMLAAFLLSTICFAYVIGWCSSALNLGLIHRNYTKMEAKAMFRKLIEMHQEMVM